MWEDLAFSGEMNAKFLHMRKSICVNLNINFHPYSIYSVRLKCHATFITVNDLIDARGVYCGVPKFLREFIFADWQFFLFCRS